MRNIAAIQAWWVIRYPFSILFSAIWLITLPLSLSTNRTPAMPPHCTIECVRNASDFEYRRGPCSGSCIFFCWSIDQWMHFLGVLHSRYTDARPALLVFPFLRCWCTAQGRVGCGIPASVGGTDGQIQNQRDLILAVLVVFLVVCLIKMSNII